MQHRKKAESMGELHASIVTCHRPLFPRTSCFASAICCIKVMR